MCIRDSPCSGGCVECDGLSECSECEPGLELVDGFCFACSSFTGKGLKEKTECVFICGNGHLGESEECDDGNLISGDGCSSTCTIEEGHKC